MNEDISRRLHEAAEAHRPDRGRMLARVQRGMAGAGVPDRKPGITTSWTRMTFTGFAVAGALATAGIAVAAIVHTAPPPDTATIPTAAPPTTSSAPSASATGSPVAPPASPPPGRTSAGVPTPATDPAPLSGTPVANGPLSSVGFVDLHTHAYWAQSRLVLKTTEPLSAFAAELRIVQTGGVQTTGHWQTMPGDDFTVTVREADGALVYRWELKPGHTVPAGVHSFAAQYGHAEGKRDARADGYVVRAGAAEVRGAFAG